MSHEHETSYTWGQFYKDFVSLTWLDGSINFVFRFVAKISELLLAIGIVMSAMDYLTHGRLMQNNLALANAWALTQAIAIESSSGVVLLYALQARKERDFVKMWLYALLALLLALVGGVMLYTQIIYSTTGIDLALHMPMGLAVAIGVARTFVSIAYIGMCRIKHVRLSGDEPPPSIAPTRESDIQGKIDEALAGLLHEMKQAQQEQIHVILQEVKRTVTEEVTQATLLVAPQQNVPAIEAPPPTEKHAQALQALRDNPAISNTALATILQVKDWRTAKTWRAKQQVSASNGYQ